MHDVEENRDGRCTYNIVKIYLVNLIRYELFTLHDI